MVKILILIVIALILLSLGLSAYYLVRDGTQGNKVVSSLTFRVVLSVLLFILLIVGYYTGSLRPHAL